MKRLITLALISLMSASFIEISAAQPVKLTTSSDSTSYAVGASMTNGLLPYLKNQMNFDEAYMDDFIAGFNEFMNTEITPKQRARMAALQIADMVHGRMLPSVKKDFEGSADSLNAKMFQEGFVAALKNDTSVFTMQQAEKFFQEHRILALSKPGIDFLTDNAKKKGVKTTASGLQYKILTKGKGAVPADTSEVKVNYEGRLIDGTVFDSSYKRGEPTTFKANQVIKGWTEALTMMPVGSKWELYIPYQLGYGERGAGKDIKPYATLIFTVELLDIVKPGSQTDAKDTAKPSTKANAKK